MERRYSNMKMKYYKAYLGLQKSNESNMLVEKRKLKLVGTYDHL